MLLNGGIFSVPRGQHLHPRHNGCVVVGYADDGEGVNLDDVLPLQQTNMEDVMWGQLSGANEFSQ